MGCCVVIRLKRGESAAEKVGVAGRVLLFL